MLLKAKYEDILLVVDGPIWWYDCNGTPRLDKFNPKFSPDPEADIVVLYLIECTACGQQFKVEMDDRKLRAICCHTYTHLGRGRFDDDGINRVKEWIYCTPPYHTIFNYANKEEYLAGPKPCVGCGSVKMLEVLEAWENNDTENKVYERRPDLEGKIEEKLDAE